MVCCGIGKGTRLGSWYSGFFDDVEDDNSHMFAWDKPLLLKPLITPKATMSLWQKRGVWFVLQL